MANLIKCGVGLFIVLLLGCNDGPNANTSTSDDNAGVHNQDGFNLTIKINNGGTVTPESKVAVQVSAANADEMYITQESACNIGGEWEDYNSFKQWTLQKENAVNFFYVKVRNSSRESDCSFTSITHDTVAPTIQLTSPNDGDTLVDPDELTLTGTCSEDGKITITINSALSVTTACLGGAWEKIVDTSALPSGNIPIDIKGADAAINSSAVQSFTFIK